MISWASSRPRRSKASHDGIRMTFRGPRMRDPRPPRVDLQPVDRVPVDDRDLLPADSTASDAGQTIESVRSCATQKSRDQRFFSSATLSAAASRKLTAVESYGDSGF